MDYVMHKPVALSCISLSLISVNKDYLTDNIVPLSHVYLLTRHITT